MKPNEKITVDQAFRTMILLLKKYQERKDSDAIASMLSDLLICPDGQTADPAAGEEWLECLQKAIVDENTGKYTIELPWRK